MRMTSTPARESARIFRLWFVLLWFVLLWFVLLLLVASPLLAQQDAVKPPPTVVFMTDFGVADDSVALCKGVMYGIAPNLRIVDLTHQVHAFFRFETALVSCSAPRPTSRPERYLWQSSIPASAVRAGLWS